MSGLKYSTDHEWVRVEGDIAVVGITNHAQDQLGDVVFVDLPSVGTDVKKGGEAAVVESVKAASDVYAPVTGEVVEVNDGLEGEPGLVNDDAEGGGWFMKIRMSDPSELDTLLDADAYAKHVESEA
jgi:glycine cleavage system H protein